MNMKLFIIIFVICFLLEGGLGKRGGSSRSSTSRLSRGYRYSYGYTRYGSRYSTSYSRYSYGYRSYRYNAYVRYSTRYSRSLYTYRSRSVRFRTYRYGYSTGYYYYYYYRLYSYKPYTYYYNYYYTYTKPSVLSSVNSKTETVTVTGVSTETYFQAKAKDQEATNQNVCINYQANTNGTALGAFTCPNPWEPTDFTFCCGAKEAQYCCRMQDDIPMIVGAVIGGLIALVVIIVIIYCSAQACREASLRKDRARKRWKKSVGATMGILAWQMAGNDQQPLVVNPLGPPSGGYNDGHQMPPVGMYPAPPPAYGQGPPPFDPAYPPPAYQPQGNANFGYM